MRNIQTDVPLFSGPRTFTSWEGKQKWKKAEFLWQFLAYSTV